MTWNGRSKAGEKWCLTPFIGVDGGINVYAYVGGNPVSKVDPLGLVTTVVCRPVQNLKARAVGAMHCFIVVWHWEVKCGKRTKVVDRQLSLAANPQIFEEGSDAPTYVEDRKNWNEGNPINQARDILPPPGMSVEDFDKAVIREGNLYDSHAGYDAVYGPNSNTATHQIIERAGRTLPNIPGAYGQNYGRP